jgi:hypothetical protein
MKLLSVQGSEFLSSINLISNAGETRDIKIANRCFENVAQFTYLGTTITNQNLIQEEIKSRLNSGNAGYNSVHTFSLLGCCLRI